jgi:hypothetical protein
MDIEDSIPALASAIISVYDIRKNIVNNELKGRDLKHVEYGIMKELENVWNMYSKKDCFSLIIELKSGISK